MSRSSSATLMTEGPIWKRMVAFAVPLFWGNLFQQLYNTVDSLIVGNFMGNNALAAVSSSGQLILLMVGFPPGWYRLPQDRCRISHPASWNRTNRGSGWKSQKSVFPGKAGW